VGAAWERGYCFHLSVQLFSLAASPLLKDISAPHYNVQCLFVSILSGEYKELVTMMEARD